MSSLGIGSVGSGSVYTSYNFNDPSRKLASGNRINTAADDAAGMAISEGMKNQLAGTNKGINNAHDMKNALNVADAGLESIADALGRIRELGVQAANGIYTQSDRKIFQEEINQLVEHINSVGENTNFNTQKLLDGTFVNKNAATGPNGEGMNVNIQGSLAEQLGIANIDVVNSRMDFDAIDNALEAVNTQRANIGAQTNRLEHTINAQETAAYNLAVSNSRKADADMAKAMLERSGRNALEQVGIHMQKLAMEGMGQFLQLMM